jgi:hypothetical protein
MRKQQIENAAFDVATQVRTVEESIEAALAELAELQSRMVRARATTGIGINASHAAFVELAAGVNSLVNARGAIASCHVALAEAKQLVPGLRTVGWGDAEECPPPSGSVDLRVVA